MTTLGDVFSNEPSLAGMLGGIVNELAPLYSGVLVIKKFRDDHRLFGYADSRSDPPFLYIGEEWGEEKSLGFFPKTTGRTIVRARQWDTGMVVYIDEAEAERVVNEHVKRYAEKKHIEDITIRKTF